MCTKLQTVVKKNTHGSNKPTRSQVYLGGGGGGGEGGSLARGTSGSPFSSAAQPCGHGDEPRLSYGSREGYFPTSARPYGSREGYFPTSARPIWPVRWPVSATRSGPACRHESANRQQSANRIGSVAPTAKMRLQPTWSLNRFLLLFTE